MELPGAAWLFVGPKISLPEISASDSSTKRRRRNPSTWRRLSAAASPHRTARLNSVLVSQGPNQLIFTAPRGGPLRYQNFLGRVWHPTLELLGLPIVEVHVLRHSAAARMIQAGGSPKTLQTVLGHRSAAFSLTVYGHLFDADLDALADKLDTTERKLS